MSTIINPTKKSNPNPPPQWLLDEITQLNEQLTTKNGEWRFIPEIGLVWQPTGDLTGSLKTLQPPTPDVPGKLLSELVEISKGIDFDSLAENSVVLIKLNTDNPMRFEALQRGIVKQVLDPRFETLKKKRICVLFLQAGEGIEVLTEDDMKAAGWEKKEKSRIITF